MEKETIEMTKHITKGITPVITLLSKLAFIGWGGGSDLLDSYLIGSVLWDYGEFVVNWDKAYNGKELKEYNFFEKRGIWDLPKWIGKKMDEGGSQKSIDSYLHENKLGLNLNK